MATYLVDDTMSVCSDIFRLQEEREIPPWSSDVDRLEPKRSVLPVGPEPTSLSWTSRTPSVST
jgi:hypothetical protein